MDMAWQPLWRGTIKEIVGLRLKIVVLSEFIDYNSIFQIWSGLGLVHILITYEYSI